MKTFKEIEEATHTQSLGDQPTENLKPGVLDKAALSCGGPKTNFENGTLELICYSTELIEKLQYFNKLLLQRFIEKSTYIDAVSVELKLARIEINEIKNKKEE